jgi:hypothetical protein
MFRLGEEIKMPVPNKSIVTVRFDGLLLFLLDERKEECEAKICTAAHDHELKITVFKSGGEQYYGPFGLEDIKGFHQINLQVNGGSQNGSSKLVKDSSYDLLINLAGEDFYSSKAQIKEGRYEASFIIKNGKIGAGNIAADCNKVNLDAFKDVSFYISETEWDELVARKKDQDPESMAKLSPFAKDVIVSIEMEEGQNFKITSKDGKLKVGPLPFKSGENYDVEIKFSDAGPLTRLKDCMGFAHHSEAVKPDGSLTYAIFRPLSAEETDVGCCKSGCFPPTSA